VNELISGVSYVDGRVSRTVNRHREVPPAHGRREQTTTDEGVATYSAFPQLVLSATWWPLHARVSGRHGYAREHSAQRKCAGNRLTQRKVRGGVLVGEGRPTIIARLRSTAVARGACVLSVN
jgi:hypothetical protein